MGLRASADEAFAESMSLLETGTRPTLLDQAIRHQLAVADARLANGNPAGAARYFERACKLGFHRALHFDDTTSPLAADASTYASPFRESSATRLLRAARARDRSAPADNPGAITLLTRGNDTFLGEISALLGGHGSTEVRHVDLLEEKALSKGLFSIKYVAEQLLTGGASPADQEGIMARAERALRPVLEETDVLFVDWCGAAAVLVNLVDPGATRVVVRLHSYEAFTHWPHLMDWSRVDDLVFVSDHLRDFTVDAVPGLSEQQAPRLHVLPLNRDLRPFVRPKRSPAARFELGLVSWGNVAKDPLWALEVLEALRHHDERYRLRLIGSGFDGQVSAVAQRYGDRLERELRRLEDQGAVLRVGQTDDVPSALGEVGVIVSASVRESFHAAVVEGAASGAVPVVRDWPFFAHRPTGARSLYPVDWVVSTPTEAAERVLRLTQDESTWRAAGEDAQRLTMQTWDWEAVRPEYERFFFG